MLRTRSETFDRHLLMSSVDLFGLKMKENRDVSKLVILVDKQFTPTTKFTMYIFEEKNLKFIDYVEIIKIGFEKCSTKLTEGKPDGSRIHLFQADAMTCFLRE